MAKKVASKKSKTARKKAPSKPAVKGMGAADAIRRLDEEFMKAADARNAGAIVKAFYGAGAVLLPPNHPIVEGPAAIQRFFQGLLDGGFTSIKLETTTVASAGDLAYGRGRYVLAMSPPAGAPVQDTGKYVVVYRRQANGGWRAVEDIFNSDQGAQ